MSRTKARGSVEHPQQRPRAVAPVIGADVMRPGELMQRLGLKHARFGELQQRGKFRHLESAVGNATGSRVYSRRKVAAWIEGPVLSATGVTSSMPATLPGARGPRQRGRQANR